jgi:hypothetical protein
MHLPLLHDGSEALFSLDLKQQEPIAVIIRSLTSARSGEKPDPDWQVEIRVKDAAVQESSNLFPFEAPESGYKSVLVWSAKAGDSQWRANFDKQIFFRMARGVYGRMHIVFLTWGDNVRIDYWINPTGSRLLDPGPPK